MNNQSSVVFLILNPGHIDPGFSGPLSICAINLSTDTKGLSLGEDIFTLVIQKLQTELTTEEAYKNKKYNPRKELEQIFLKNNSKRLSNSFFDLILGYEGSRKLLVERLRESFWNSLKAVTKILAVLAGIAGILKLGHDAFPDSMPVYKHNEKRSQDSINMAQKDSIINYKDQQLKNLKDSLRKGDYIVPTQTVSPDSKTKNNKKDGQGN